MCIEDPAYRLNFESNRRKAGEALSDMVDGKDMREAAQLLLQVSHHTTPALYLLKSHSPRLLGQTCFQGARLLSERCQTLC